MLKTILYIDDEEDARNDFKEKFDKKDGFTKVTLKKNTDDALLLLKQSSTESLPDLIVVDLYGNLSGLHPNEINKNNTSIESIIKCIKLLRDELRKELKKDKEPAGVIFLKELRKRNHLKKIPVVIRTREGMTTLDDKMFHEAVEEKVRWSVKTRDEKTEKLIFLDAYNSKSEVVVVEEKHQGEIKESKKFQVLNTAGGIIFGIIVATIFHYFNKT